MGTHPLTLAVDSWLDVRYGSLLMAGTAITVVGVVLLGRFLSGNPVRGVE